MNTLDTIRKDINSVDQQIVELMKQRFALSRQVADAKKGTGLPIHDPARERYILNQLCDQAGTEYATEIRMLYAKVFALSKARQRAHLNQGHELIDEIKDALQKSAQFPQRTLVACPGLEGAYTQLATTKFFPLPTILFFNNFEKVFEAVEQGLCPYGVLPVENTAAGSVIPVYDAMMQHKFHIVRSCRMRIDHVLLGKPGATLKDIQHVSSHPQALAQCTHFLKEHPSWSVTPSSNTAVAAKKLSEEGTVNQAVIASKECAELYGLTILADNLSDTTLNYTRFICISRNLEIFDNARKLSLMLELPHTPGSLSDLLDRFAVLDMNLTKLESRPIPGRDFQFLFTFDFEASPKDPKTLLLLEELASDPQITHFTFLGAYDEN
ncbi:MAG: chorismate mutase [Lentisphaeria bacterium]|nr:chorismate mutase [Lentisphaeria bacterium]